MLIKLTISGRHYQKCNLNMKRLIIIVTLVCSYFMSNAQALSKPMQDYKCACLKLVEGINSDFDKYILSDAIDLFRKVKITEIPDELCVPVENNTDAEILPKIYFVKAYADSLIRAQKIVELDNISIVNKGEDNDIFIKHKGIKAHTSVSYKSIGNGSCEMMIIGYPSSSLSLNIRDITSDNVYHGRTEDSTNVTYCIWTLPKNDTEFIFTIENLSDADATVVIAIN